MFLDIRGRLDRRRFVQGAGGSLLLPLIFAGPPGNWRALAQGTAAGIDAHCHIFNASDLPVQSFLQRVIFEDYEDASVPEASAAVPPQLAGLLATLISFLKLGVISADTELAQLTANEESLLSQYDPFSPRVQQELEDVLEQVLGAREMVAGTGLRLTPDARTAYRTAIDREIRLGSSGATEALAGSRGARLLAGRGFIGRHLRWAAWLRSPRMRLAEEMHRLYGGSGRIGLFTPALIDYARWLDEEPRSDIASQIEVMEAVQKIAIRRKGFMIHCLAPYDPWRQVTDLLDGIQPTALDIVKQAVEQRGFVGVKLYPPMGFLPTGNKGRTLSYPVRADDIDDFQTKIDSALDDLYQWAEREGVAILAHAANSMGAGEKFSERAKPEGWRSVLRRFPNLRLNLAHFGEFHDKEWEDSFGKLFAEFPNIYADISYLNGGLSTQIADIRAIAAKLKLFLARFDQGVDRIVYGSDWIMLGREPDHERYLDALRTLLIQAGVNDAQWRKVTSENAIRLYGLNSGQMARSRLQDWYRNSPSLDATLLQQFN
ncbi:amidohydrolase family protein [Sinorhizobium meliloti]|nr:amidohydrolase family protein [Sinorhizobium meliloti]